MIKHLHELCTVFMYLGVSRQQTLYVPAAILESLRNEIFTASETNGEFKLIMDGYVITFKLK